MEQSSSSGPNSKKDGAIPRRGSGDKKRHKSTSVSHDGTSGASASDERDKTNVRRSSSKRSSTKAKKSKDKELKPQKSLDRSSSNQSSTSMEDGQIEMLTPKENGYVDDAEGGEAEEEKGKRNASIKGMWKKAFKSLKSNDKQNWLSKKGSLIKRKDSEEKEEQEEISKEIDPVYSLLKCAADLPKVPKSQKEPQCSGGHSSGSTSKASSPSSSGQHILTCPSQTSIHSICGGGVVGSPTGTGSAYSQVYVGNGSTTYTPFFGGNKTSREREHMHHIVDESLGSEFRTFYKLTSPVKKTFIPSFESVAAKKAQGPNFEGVVKRQTSYDAV